MRCDENKSELKAAAGGKKCLTCELKKKGREVEILRCFPRLPPNLNHSQVIVSAANTTRLIQRNSSHTNKL